jgi:hypothetical protein
MPIWCSRVCTICGSLIAAAKWRRSFRSRSSTNPSFGQRRPPAQVGSRLSSRRAPAADRRQLPIPRRSPDCCGACRRNPGSERHEGLAADRGDERAQGLCGAGGAARGKAPAISVHRASPGVPGTAGRFGEVNWRDGQGACLLVKRLERGRLVWPQATDGKVSLTRRSLRSARGHRLADAAAALAAGGGGIATRIGGATGIHAVSFTDV